MPARCPLRALPVMLVVAAGMAVASTGVAGQLEVTLDPPYVEGVTGGGGWYRVDVTATYTCTPSGSEVTTSCPPTEVFGNGAGAEAVAAAGNDGGEDGGRFSTGIVRAATFQRRDRTRTASVRLESARGVPLRVDTQPPPVPVISRPVASAPGLEPVVVPGTALMAAYTCSFEGDRSGPAPVAACVGTVPDGQPLDTGLAADASTWGRRAFTVTARDAAGNTSTATLRYRVRRAPIATLSGMTVRMRNTRALRPAAGARLAGSVTLRWPRSGGAVLYNVQVFRVVPGGYRKVLSAFPRGNRLSMRASRLNAGTGYVWRVWPYMGRAHGYSSAPIGISWFRAAPTAATRPPASRGA